MLHSFVITIEFIQHLTLKLANGLIDSPKKDCSTAIDEITHSKQLINFVVISVNLRSFF